MGKKMDEKMSETDKLIKAIIEKFEKNKIHPKHGVEACFEIAIWCCIDNGISKEIMLDHICKIYDEILETLKLLQKDKEPIA